MNLLSLVDSRLDNIYQIRRKCYYSFAWNFFNLNKGWASTGQCDECHALEQPAAFVLHLGWMEWTWPVCICDESHALEQLAELGHGQHLLCWDDAVAVRNLLPPLTVLPGAGGTRRRPRDTATWASLRFLPSVHVYLVLHVHATARSATTYRGHSTVHGPLPVFSISLQYIFLVPFFRPRSKFFFDFGYYSTFICI